MKRQLKSLFLIAALTLISSGCGDSAVPTENGEQIDSQAPAADTEDPKMPIADQADGQEKNVREERPRDVKIALVTDVSSVMDNGFNQAALQGIETYGAGAGVSYTAYSTKPGEKAAYEEIVLTAIREEAELVICAGAHFEQAVGKLQNEYEDISFLLLDGVPRDDSGEPVDAAANVHCITYREDEAGYLVGYMAVLEGYRQFGFIGGEELPSVQRYGYGYLRGIDDAAAFLDVGEDVQVEYWYADTFQPDGRIEEMSAEWYRSGTEIIFACGGSLYQSVLASAEICDGMLIGVDTDQSGISERFLTSAVKGVDSSVIVALDEFFANSRRWPEKLAGHAVSYGAKEKCVVLPVQDKAWRFQKATMKDYLQILARLRSGDISVLTDTETVPDTHVTVNYHEQQEEKDS